MKLFAANTHLRGCRSAHTLAVVVAVLAGQPTLDDAVELAGGPAPREEVCVAEPLRVDSAGPAASRGDDQHPATTTQMKQRLIAR